MHLKLLLTQSVHVCVCLKGSLNNRLNKFYSFSDSFYDICHVAIDIIDGCGLTNEDEFLSKKTSKSFMTKVAYSSYAYT